MRAQTILSLFTGVAITVLAANTAQAGFQWTAPNSMPAGATAATGTALPHVPAAPVAPVATETLPSTLNDVTTNNAIATTPDGPVSAAPIYGQGPNGPMTNDPISWNTPASAPRAPQSVLPAETQNLYPAGPAVQTTYTAPVATAVVATPLAAPATPTAMIAAAPNVAAPATAIVPTPVGYGVYEMAEGFGTNLPLVMAIRQVVPASYGFVFDDSVNLSTNVSWQGGRPWNAVLSDMLTPLGLRASINAKVVSIVPMTSAAPMQQIAMTGPAVSTDVVGSTATGNVMAPVITPAAPAIATPAVYTPSPAITATPIASSRIDLGATTTWTAPRNSTLRGILEDWSKRVGVELYWASEYDYPIQSAVSINGSFEDAVQTLLRGLNESRPRPLGRLHPNLPNGPAVLVIETRQNSM